MSEIRPGHEYELCREQFLPLDLETAFDFFRDPRNLERITPPWMGFRLVGEPPAKIEQGTRIDYRIRLFGVPMAWRTLISLWEPPHAFIDFQERGPYRRWEHLHTLEPMADGVLMRDRVRYRLPFDPLSRPIHALFIRPTLERIFNHRYEAVRARFGSGERPWGAAGPASIAAASASDGASSGASGR